jgi:hypothetical protein
VREPDFEIGGRLEADSMTPYAPPDESTAVEGDGVVLERAQSRRGLPADLVPGVKYSNISIEKHVSGQNEGFFRVENPRPATPATGAFSEGPSRGGGGSSVTTSPTDEEAVANRDMSNDLTAAVKRRHAAREKRRKALSLDRQPVDGALEPDENGAPLPHDDSVSAMAADAKGLPVRMVFGLGALVGAAAGATAANLASRRRDVILGDVRIDLLKRVELLSIKLRLHRASEDRVR